MHILSALNHLEPFSSFAVNANPRADSTRQAMTISPPPTDPKKKKKASLFHPFGDKKKKDKKVRLLYDVTNPLTADATYSHSLAHPVPPCTATRRAATTSATRHQCTRRRTIPSTIGRRPSTRRSADTLLGMCGTVP